MSFTFTDLQLQLPAGTLTETADDVTISLKTLTGSTTVQLADDTVANAVHDLLEGCAAAQTSYNDTNSPAMNTFATPTYSAATVRSDGQRKSNATFTVVTTTPLDFTQTEANMA